MISKIGNRLLMDPVPQENPFLLGFGKYMCVLHTHIKEWLEIWQWWSLKWKLGSRGEAAEAGKEQMRYRECQAVICFLSFHQQNLMKSFQSQSYRRQCVFMRSTMLTDWKLGSQKCNSFFICACKNVFAICLLNHWCNFRWFPLQFTDDFPKPAQFYCIFCIL